jgi:hypothetical protein
MTIQDANYLEYSTYVDYNKTEISFITGKPIDNTEVIAEEWLLKPDFIPAQVNKVGGFENNDLQFNSRSVVVVATRLQNYNKFKEMLKKYAWQTSGEWEVDMKPEWLKLYKENNNTPLIINLI